MGVVERIMAHAERLTSTERKIAEVLAGEPQTIAFGTVAQVASRAGTSGPSVVRLAVKLGYEGFVDLQSEVQAELASQLGPARDRIRQRPPSDLLARVQTAEQDNVLSTLHAINPQSLDGSVAMLADPCHRVWVMSGEVMSPIGSVLASQIGQLRDGVTEVSGSEVAISRALAGLEAGDTLIVIDIRRYERSLVSVVRWAAERGAAVIALTDSPLSPLAVGAVHTFFMSAGAVGPFDSLTGGMALANAIVTSLAARLRQSAPARLDAIEAAWSATGALVAEPGGVGPLPGVDRISGGDPDSGGGGGADGGSDADEVDVGDARST